MNVKIQNKRYKERDMSLNVKLFGDLVEEVLEKSLKSLTNEEFSKLSYFSTIEEDLASQVEGQRFIEILSKPPIATKQLKKLMSLGAFNER